MPEPFLESTHLAGEAGDADCAVAHQPRYQHDRQTCTQTEDDGHQPVPRAGKRERDVNHCQEIYQPVGAESDCEEDT